MMTPAIKQARRNTSEGARMYRPIVFSSVSNGSLMKGAKRIEHYY